MPTRGQKSLGMEQLIEAYDVDPTDWEFGILVDGIRKVKEWRSYIDRSLVPPDFGGSTDPTADNGHQGRADFKDIKDQVFQFQAQLLAEAKTWREYRISKKRSVDMTGTVDVGLAEVLQAMNDGSGTTKGG